MKPDPTATWSVRTMHGIVRLTISGKFHQEFEIESSQNPAFYYDMLTRAMRRLAPEREATKRKGKR